METYIFLDTILTKYETIVLKSHDTFDEVLSGILNAENDDMDDDDDEEDYGADDINESITDNNEQTLSAEPSLENL